MKNPQHYWQDARLKKALANAPDAQLMPSTAIRKTIIDAACQVNQIKTVKAARPTIRTVPNWLLRLNQYLFDSPSISLTAIGSLLVIGCVALLWSLNDPKEILTQGDLLQPPVAASTPVLPKETPRQTQDQLRSDNRSTPHQDQVRAPVSSVETPQPLIVDKKSDTEITSSQEAIITKPRLEGKKRPSQEIAPSSNQGHTSSRSKKTVDQNRTDKSQNAIPTASKKEVPANLTQAPPKPTEQEVEPPLQQQIATLPIQSQEPMSGIQGQMQGASSDAQKQTVTQDKQKNMELNKSRESLTIDVPANTSTSKNTRMSSSKTTEISLFGQDAASSNATNPMIDHDSMSTTEGTNQSDFEASSFGATVTNDVALLDGTTEKFLPPIAHLSQWDCVEIQQRGTISALTRSQSKELPALIARMFKTTAITQQPLARFTPPKTDVIFLRFFEKQRLSGTLYIDRVNWFFVPQPNLAQTVITGTLTVQDAEHLKEKLQHLSP